MAKKIPSKENGGVNKSQAIRDALEEDPKASPKQLSAQLVAQGIDVSPAYVSTIKTGMRSKAKRGRRSIAAGSKQEGTVVVASEILEAKKLVDRVGSIEKAESLLGTLKKLL